jgi:PAS domain S-box-containing protein
MLRRLNIGTKILIAFVSIAILAVVVVGLVSFQLGSRTLEEESFNKLTAVREMKAGQIEDYYQQIVNQVITLSEDRMIIDAMRAFDEDLHIIETELGVTDADRESMDAELRRYYQDEYLERLIPNLLEEASVSDYWPEDEDARLMQSMYITANPHPAGSKHLLDAPGDGSSYSQTHEIYHPIIRDFLERFGYYDIFLVDVDTGGHISYSVFKEVDYGTSLLYGPYSETNFAEAYRAARDADDPEFVKLVDFEPYAPSYNAPAAFIASPIFDGDEKIGVLVFQMPIDRINNIMTSDHNWSDVGLGDSGETYIVGDDFLLRNQSRFLIEDSENYFKTMEEIGVPLETRAKIRNFDSTIGLQEVKTEGAQAALSGETGTAIFPDYRGLPVLSAYKPLDIPGVNWAIMSEIDREEAFASVRALGIRTLGVVAILIVGLVVLAVVFSRTITRPLEELTATADELATGNLDVEVRYKDQGDEIGVLASSFDSMRVSMKDLIRDLEDMNRNLEAKVAERTAELERATVRVRSIIENASDAIITIDSDQNIVLFNPWAEKTFGYTQEEVVGKPLTMLMVEKSRAIHPHEVDRFRNEPAISRGMDVRREIHGQRKDGTTFPAEAGISKMVLDGEVFFTAFLRDVTERVEAQEQLEEVNKAIADQLTFTQTLIDAIPNPIFVKDSDARYLTFNRAYEEAYGVRREDWIGKTVMDVEHLSPEQRERFRDEDAEHLKTGGLKQEELDATFADGKAHSIMQWVTTFEQSDGTIGGLLGVTADITERKRLEMELERANERMSVELNFAREIQIGMLPLIFPAFPRRKEVDLYATLRSAREVGGDFYDFYFLDNDHLCFIFADVSGKGAPGALLMAVSKTLIKSRAADDHEPASILTHVNEELSRDNESAMFVTAFLGILNVRTGELRYTNAGHNPPYIKRANGTVEIVDAFHGPVIGALPGMTYGQDRTVLDHRDMILLYTDGVTEAMDETEALYTDERLALLLQAEDLDAPETTVDGTLRDVLAHQGEAEQADDITILVVQYTGKPEEVSQARLRLRIKNQLAELAVVEERFHEFALENDIPDAVRQPISIVLDEMLNNIVSYAYQDEDEHEIDIHIELSGGRLVLTITDDGAPFNPFGRGAPDTSLSVEDREIGGLGIHLVRNMMDEYLYQRHINKNIVTLVKMTDEPSS